MSKVKVEVQARLDCIYVFVDGKRVCSTPYETDPDCLVHVLELVLAAMDVENVEVSAKP